MSRLPTTDLRLFRHDPDAAAHDDPDRWRFFPTAPRSDVRARAAEAEGAVRLVTDAAFRPRDRN